MFQRLLLFIVGALLLLGAGAGVVATRRVSRDNFEKVLARMDEAIKKKRLTGSRDRGTALIIKSVKGDIKEYILPKGSKDIQEIEALLYTLF